MNAQAYMPLTIATWRLVLYDLASNLLPESIWSASAGIIWRLRFRSVLCYPVLPRKATCFRYNMRAKCEVRGGEDFLASLRCNGIEGGHCDGPEREAA